MSSNYCECCQKLSISCPFKLKVIGYISGWLGTVWRIVLVALFSTTTSNITSYDPSLISIVVISCLAYLVTSFIINCLFLYGVFREKRYLLLPYITIVALEMVVGVIISSGLVMLAFAIAAIGTAIYILCIAVLVIGVHFTLWLYNILFYKDLEYEAMISSGKKTNIALTNINMLDI